MVEESVADPLLHRTDDSRQGSELMLEKFRPNAGVECVEHERDPLVAVLSFIVVCSVEVDVNESVDGVVTSVIVVCPGNVLVDASGEVDISITSVLVRSVDIALVGAAVCSVNVTEVALVGLDVCWKVYKL